MYRCTDATTRNVHGNARSSVAPCIVVRLLETLKMGGYKIEEAKSKTSLWKNFCDVAFAEITDVRLVYDILPQASAIICYAKGLPKLSAMDPRIQVHAVS